jgi:hypothetical protein
MNQKCITTIEKLSSTFEQLCEGLHILGDAIRNEDDDQVEEALDGFPTRAALGSALEKLGLLIGNRPWESGRKKKANA